VLLIPSFRTTFSGRLIESKGLLFLLGPLAELGQTGGYNLGQDPENAGNRPVAVPSSSRVLPCLATAICILASLLAIPLARSHPTTSWRGVLRDMAGSPISNATVKLRATTGSVEFTATTTTSGEFSFAEIAGGTYDLSVSAGGHTWKAANPLVIRDGSPLTAGLELSKQEHIVTLLTAENGASRQGTGGEHLSSGEVSLARVSFLQTLGSRIT
jgi:hypothetical protein